MIFPLLLCLLKQFSKIEVKSVNQLSILFDFEGSRSLREKKFVNRNTIIKRNFTTRWQQFVTDNFHDFFYNVRRRDAMRSCACLWGRLKSYPP